MVDVSLVVECFEQSVVAVDYFEESVVAVAVVDDFVYYSPADYNHMVMHCSVCYHLMVDDIHVAAACLVVVGMYVVNHHHLLAHEIVVNIVDSRNNPIK
jgi:hypothetical protein